MRIWDMAKPERNKYCRISDLSNEASVETFFVARLLVDLGYEDSDVLTKQAIQELQISKGRKKEKYRPDFMLTSKKLPR